MLMLSKIINNLTKKIYDKFKDSIKIGIICTAYSNGSTLLFIEDFLKKNQSENFIELKIVKTGVKYLQEEAEKFDLAIEIESNGHGKVSHRNDYKISKLLSHCETTNDIFTIELMIHFLNLFNPTVGDSISLLLAIECSLYSLQLSLKDWKRLMTPLHYSYLKLKVYDKNIYKCNESETKLISPSFVQDFLDELNEKYKSYLCRCFIRPSGTEDILRVYCEASDIKIVKEVLIIVEKYILENVK